MKEFPIEKLIFTGAKIQGSDKSISIEVAIEPFELELDGYSEVVDTVLLLDGISIPANPAELEKKEFNFPTNPSDGYIDGSIYFFSAYSPVDVTRINFGSIESGKLPVVFETLWVLEYENTGFRNLTKTVATNIEL